MKKLLAIYIVPLLIFSACSAKQEEITQEKVARFISVELSNEEIFDLAKENFKPKFSKYANSEAKNKSTIIAQASGQIIDLPVSIGEKVKANQKIAQIGNSLSQDINQSQINASNDSLTLIEESKENLIKGTNLSLESAEIGLDTAKEGLKNANEQLKNSEDLYDIQYDSANSAYKTAKNAYNDASDALENFKLNNFDPEKIAEMEAQVRALKTAYKQSKYALEQMEEARNSQKDQLKYAIEIAKNQYELAEKQYEAAKISGSSQILSLEGQSDQIASGKELLEINKKYNTITTPISGIVSQVFVSKNSFIGNGQMIAEIEDPSEIILTTSLNEEEIKLITKYDLVEIETDEEVISGKINHIAYTPDPSTKKYEIEISLPKNSDIKSGKMIKTTFTSAKTEEIFIPINSVSIREGKKTVKIINEKNFIEEIEIDTGSIFAGLIEVKNGLTGNETILAQGQSFLEKGTKIVINK